MGYMVFRKQNSNKESLIKRIVSGHDSYCTKLIFLVWKPVNISCECALFILLLIAALLCDINILISIIQ